MLATKLGKSYWDKNGVYQIQFDQMYKTLVPDCGNSKTLNGELIRSISRLFYEYCNNGNCNSAHGEYTDIIETCSVCNGTGIVDDEDCPNCDGMCDFCDDEELSDSWVTEMYENFLKLIGDTIPTLKPTLAIIRTIITDSLSLETNTDKSEYFDPKVINYYNIMCDNVVFYCINNEDKELPQWYLTTKNISNE